MEPPFVDDTFVNMRSSGSGASALEREEQEPAFPKQNCYGRCCGRVFKDGAQPPGLFGLTAGVGGYGVGYGMENEMIKIIAVAALVFVILLYHVRISMLKPEKNLEDQVDYYIEQVKRLEKNVINLEKQRDRLEKVLLDANASISDLARTLKVPVDRLDRLSEVYKEVKDKLSAVVEASEQYRLLSQEVAGQIKQINSAGKVAQAVAVDLGRKVDRLDQVEGDLSEEVGEYMSAVQYHRAQNAQLKALSTRMQADLQGLQNRYFALVDMLKQLQENTLKIDEADDKFKDGGAEFNQGAKALQEKVANDLERMLALVDAEADNVEVSEKAEGIVLSSSSQYSDAEEY